MKQKVVKWVMIAVAAAFLTVMLVLPFITVCTYALSQGWRVFWAAVTDVYAQKALRLTLLATAIAVAVNTVFGVFAAWAVGNFRFRGRQVLAALMDIPFSISPVIVGLMFLLIFGRNGWAHPLLDHWNLQVVFAVPGIVLVTVFVTFPFVSRELIPVMQTRGHEEEEAAALMGAKGFTIFRKVTLPHIKWALLYGVILCTARSLGEFGAVSVVSGHLQGKTDTLPLHIEALFNAFHLSAAFAVSTILMCMAFVILVLRSLVEYRLEKEER